MEVIPDLEERSRVTISKLEKSIDTLRRAMLQYAVNLEVNKDLSDLISNYSNDLSKSR